MDIRAIGVTDIYKNFASSVHANMSASVANSKKDEVNISFAGNDYIFARRAVSSVSDIRIDLVNRISAEIEAGIYDIHSIDIAAKMLGRA